MAAGQGWGSRDRTCGNWGPRGEGAGFQALFQMKTPLLCTKQWTERKRRIEKASNSDPVHFGALRGQVARVKEDSRYPESHAKSCASVLS